MYARINEKQKQKYTKLEHANKHSRRNEIDSWTCSSCNLIAIITNISFIKNLHLCISLMFYYLQKLFVDYITWSHHIATKQIIKKYIVNKQILYPKDLFLLNNNLFVYFSCIISLWWWFPIVAFLNHLYQIVPEEHKEKKRKKIKTRFTVI